MTTFFDCGGKKIALRSFWRLAEPLVVGRRRILRLWLEEFLGGVKNYIALKGDALLKTAVALKGTLPLEAFWRAADPPSHPRRAVSSFLSKILSLDR